MINYNVNIENSSISFKNQKIKIADSGLYLIQGDNGVGKSTILKDIVFNFESADVKKGDISYVAQDPVVVKCRVSEYLSRLNENIDTVILDKVLKKFNIDEIPKKKLITKLSGGEVTKLNIASGFAKGSNFIFLDEPTNNLDDDSVEVLLELVKEFAKEKAIVIITHDERLKKLNHKAITVKPNSIEMQYDETENCQSDKRDFTLNYPTFKMLKKAVFNKDKFGDIFFNVSMMFSILTLNFILVTNYYYYDFEHLPPNNIISVTRIDGKFDELNMTYAKGAGIINDIDENDYHKLIAYQDIPDIAERFEVDDIIYPDIEYLYTINHKISDGKSLDDLNYVTIPHILSTEHFNDHELSMDIKLFEEGRFPLDDKYEVALSKAVLKKYFKDVDVENPMGQIVTIQGVDYKIVGITPHDVCLLSYTKERCCGYVSYNKDTFTEIVERNIKYKKSIDAPNVNNPIALVIKTKSVDNGNILNSLLITYPANNYFNYIFDKVFLDYNQRRALKIMLKYNSIVILFILLIKILIAKKEKKVRVSRYKLYDDYYLCKGRTLKVVRMGEFIIDVFVALSFFGVVLYLKKVYILARHIPIKFMAFVFFMLVVLYYPTSERKNLKIMKKC